MWQLNVYVAKCFPECQWMKWLCHMFVFVCDRVIKKDGKCIGFIFLLRLCLCVDMLKDDTFGLCNNKTL